MNLIINKLNNSNIAFKARLNRDGANLYSQEYAFDSSLNGNAPDEFVLSRIRAIQQNTPRREILVADLGAGQGRNTIPIAKMGCNICAYELSNEGRNDIFYNAHRDRVAQRILVSDANILDPIKVAKKADFAFMSHVSQHFNIAELQQTFKNVSDAIKNGGEFVFDALVRISNNYKKYDKMPLSLKLYDKRLNMETYGAASFRREDVLDAAKKAGFSFVEELPFLENIAQRASYERQNLWGGFSILDFLTGLPRKPVVLKWFVFKK